MHRREQKRNWWLARYQRSFVPWLICFAFGMALCAYQYEPGGPMPDWTHPWLLASWLFVFWGTALLSRKRQVWVVALSLCAILLGGGYYRFQHLTAGPQDVSRFAGGMASRVIGEWYTQSDNPKNAVLLVQSVNAQPARGRLQVKLSRGKGLSAFPGALVAIEGRLSMPELTTIPGAFQEWRYLASQRVTAVLHHPSRLETLQAEPVSPEGYLHRNLFQLRHRIAQTFSGALPSPLSEILGGIVLGDQAIPVERELRQAFARTGLIHLLAASGMNVGIVAGLLFMLARLFRLPPRLQILTGMSGALVYALLSGLSPSVLRATMMLEIALSLKLLDKTLSHLFVLLLAVVGLLLWNVELVTSVGFQLSVITTFGIVTMLGPLQKRIGYYTGEAIAATFLLPLVAQVWAMPLLITYFNAFPLLGVPLNLLAVPMVIALTGIGFFSALLGLLYQPLGIAFAKISWPFLWLLHQLVTVTASWQWSQWHLPSLPAFSLIACYCVLLFVSYALAFPSAARLSGILKCLFRPKIALSMSLLSAGLCLACWQSKTPAIHVLPVGKAVTAFLLEDGSQTALLLPASVTPWQGRKIADYLRHRNVLALSHLLWMPTMGQKRSESTRKAVLERLESGVRVLKVSDARSFHPKRFAWKISAYPLQPPAMEDAGFKSAMQPLWQLSAHHFCLVSVYRDLRQPVTFKTPKRQCPLQWLEKRHSSRRLASSWSLDALPADRYFKFVYRSGQWWIER